MIENEPDPVTEENREERVDRIEDATPLDRDRAANVHDEITDAIKDFVGPYRDVGDRIAEQYLDSDDTGRIARLVAGVIPDGTLGNISQQVTEPNQISRAVTYVVEQNLEKAARVIRYADHVMRKNSVYAEYEIPTGEPDRADSDDVDGDGER